MGFRIERSGDETNRHYKIAGAGLPQTCDGLLRWVASGPLTAEQVGERKANRIELAVSLAPNASIGEVDALIDAYFNQNAASVRSEWMHRR